MKKAILFGVLYTLLVCLVACGGGDNSMSTATTDTATTTTVTTSTIKNIEKKSLLELKSEEIFDLLGKPLDEVFAVIGDYSQDVFREKNIYHHDFDMFLNDSNEVKAISTQRPYDFYKGISVGKTIAEINANPELEIKLMLQRGEFYFAQARIPYKDIYIYMELHFSDGASGFSDSSTPCSSISIAFPVEGHEEYYENIPVI